MAQAASRNFVPKPVTLAGRDGQLARQRAVEILPVSKDALIGPGILMNLAVVYAWTDEPDLAFETLEPLTRIPNGIYYGQLRRESYWQPLRQDRRYEKMLAALAPRG